MILRGIHRGVWFIGFFLICASTYAVETSDVYDPPSMRSILDQHFESSGGRLALANFHSLGLRGIFSTNEQSLNFQFYRKRPDRWRLHVSGNSGEFVRGFDGTERWEKHSGHISGEKGESLFSEAKILDALLDEVRFVSRLVSLSRSGADLFTETKEVTEDGPILILRGNFTGGAFARLGVDFEHFQVVFFEEKVGDRLTRREFSDHRTVQSLQLPSKIRMLIDSEFVGEITLQEMTVNPGLFDTFFAEDF